MKCVCAFGHKIIDYNDKFHLDPKDNWVEGSDLYPRTRFVNILEWYSALSFCNSLIALVLFTMGLRIKGDIWVRAIEEY